MKLAIDLQVQLEAKSNFDPEDISKDEEPLVAILQAPLNQSQLGKSQRDSKKIMHLTNLFLYLHAPPENASDADKKVFDTSIDGDHLRCLCLI